jgi:hypothetical protein
LKSVDIDNYYSPKDANHRGVESMCVAAAAGTRYLCLFQTKIRGQLKDTVEGLNQAAKDLGSIWQGKFLYIVYALNAAVEDGIDHADHPALLVNEKVLDVYFTPTLSTAARLQLERHLPAHETNE